MSARDRLSKAFRRAYEDAGLSQEALSEVTGIRQATISKYARGEVQPPIDVLELVDEACGQPKGHVLRLAGFVDDTHVDVKAAIEAAPDLDRLDKDAIRGLYNVLRRRNRSAASNTVSADPARIARKSSSSASR